MFQLIVFAGVLALVSAIIHAFGLLALFFWQTQQWPKIEADFRPLRNLSMIVAFFGVILTLHLIEISLWAGFYVFQQCMPDFETSFYFSVSSYTTLGYGDVVLTQPWRLLGSLESLVGVLLLGWSAAFFFNVVGRFFDLRIQKWRKI